MIGCVDAHIVRYDGLLACVASDGVRCVCVILCALVLLSLQMSLQTERLQNSIGLGEEEDMVDEEDEEAAASKK